MQTAAVIRIDALYEGWGRYLLATVRLGDGSVIKREVEDHGRASAVLAYDPQRRVALLVSQLRAPLLVAGEADGMVLEVPAGLQDEDDPAACARREAEEEVGLRLTDLEKVVSSYSMPGISTERIDLFLAAYSEGDRTGVGGGLPEETEQLTVVEKPLSELAALADRGELHDMKTLLLVQTLRLRRPDLFGG